MKNYLLLIMLMLILVACEATSITPTDLQDLTFTMHPELTATDSKITPSPIGLTSTLPVCLTSTPTSTPTPAISIDFSRFDLDVHPPIIVRHSLPLIASRDETVNLRFNFVCAYSSQSPGATCISSVTLFTSYGAEDDFMPVALAETYEDGFRILSADPPASDESGQPLRYYIQVNDPQVGVDIRYPTAGTIDLFVADEFIPIELAAPPPEETGELILALPWGSGSEAVGLRVREGYPEREGPFALDVAGDGRIALLDHVNQRVLIYDPNGQGFRSIGLPFQFKNQGDLQFGPAGQLAVFDAVGEPIDQPTINIPRLYLFYQNGEIASTAPVFATFPTMLTRDLEVLDSYDGRLVAPFSLTGEANPREDQRLRHSPNLLYRFTEDLDPYVAQFADVEAGLAFEIRSTYPLGAITLFEKVSQGYIAIFYAEQIRAVWFDLSGNILKDITLPNLRYSEIYPQGQVVVNENGELYILGSVEAGIEVRYIRKP
jgi:hypothetical protein